MYITKVLQRHKDAIIEKALNNIPNLIKGEEKESLEDENLNIVLQRVWSHARTNVNDVIKTFTNKELRIFLKKEPSDTTKRNKMIREIKKMEEVKEFKRGVQKSITKEEVLSEIKKEIEKQKKQRKMNEGIPGTDEWFFVYFKKNAVQYKTVIKEALVKNIVRIFLTSRTKENKMLNYKEFEIIEDFFKSDAFKEPSITKRKEYIFNKTMQAVVREGSKDILKELSEEKFDNLVGENKTYYTHTKPFVFQTSVTKIYKEVLKEMKEESFPNVFLEEMKKDKELKKKWQKQRLRGLF